MGRGLVQPRCCVSGGHRRSSPADVNVTQANILEREDRRPLLWVFLLVSMGYLVPIARWGTSISADWDYFNALALLVRSSVLSYQVFPLHNPWACGGLDLLTNPQTRILSPLLLLDIVLPPLAANWVSLWLFALAGAVGAYLMCKDAGRMVGVVMASLWANASFFALHFAEGHIPFAHMLLLPWIPVLMAQLNARWARLALVALVTHMALAGGGYATIFAVYVTLTCLFVVRVPWRFDPKFDAALCLGALCFLVARALPAVTIGTSTFSRADFTEMDWTLFLSSLFLPIQHGRIAQGFHEYGCYFGIAAVVMAVRYAPKRELWWVVLFWVWVGTGLGRAFNPWSLHRAIPLLNAAHVQTRTLIIAYLFFLLLLKSALAGRDKRWLIFFAVEALVIHTITFNAGWVNTPAADPTPSLTSTSAWHGTIESATKPNYYDTGHGSVTCYEPSNDTRSTPAQVAPDTEIVSFTPGKLTVRVAEAGIYTINTHSLGGWSGAPVLSKPRGMLRVELPAGETVLHYAPLYWYPMWILLILGLICFAVLAHLSASPKSAKANAADRLVQADDGSLRDSA